jgi:hypothetical protein
MNDRPLEPKLDRDLTLHLRGDWGMANFHRVCGWVSQGLIDRAFAELRARAPRLRLATGLDDGVNNTGLAAHTILHRAGIDVIGWGGQFLGSERPFESFSQVLTGQANAIFQEAIMLPPWQDFAPDHRFLPIENEVLTGLETDYGWPSATVPASYFPGVAAFRTLDFADFLVITTTALDDEVAYAVAWILGETRHLLENQYSYFPPARNPITLPLDPPTMGHTHPAAHRRRAQQPCRPDDSAERMTVGRFLAGAEAGDLEAVVDTSVTSGMRLSCVRWLRLLRCEFRRRFGRSPDRCRGEHYGGRCGVRVAVCLLARGSRRCRRLSTPMRRPQRFRAALS